MGKNPVSLIVRGRLYEGGGFNRVLSNEVRLRGLRDSKILQLVNLFLSCYTVDTLYIHP
jgi:hypothetical protein